MSLSEYRVLFVRCAGTTRFARDFRKLRSQWDPSDVGKRREEENYVVRRTALPTATVVRAARLLGRFSGPTLEYLPPSYLTVTQDHVREPRGTLGSFLE